MDHWEDTELEAAVVAYLQMLEYERSGRQYSKAEVNLQLREHQLRGRSKGAVEYRMQNISAVLEELGDEWMRGYKPARNVGSTVKLRIASILESHRNNVPNGI